MSRANREIPHYFLSTKIDLAGTGLAGARRPTAGFRDGRPNPDGDQPRRSGVEAVFGVIYPPQVALVGLGRVIEQPVAVDGRLTVHPTVTATLSADHRASDGATGARFLTSVDRLLQRPEEL